MHKIILALAILAFAATAAKADERRLASLNALTAVAPTGFQCAEASSIVVRAPNEAAFQGDRRELQRLLGGVRASLGFECPKLSTLMVQGDVAGRSVYRGVTSKDTGWVLIDIESAESKTAAADSGNAPANPAPVPSPPVAVAPAAPSSGPAFNCANVRHLVERMICGDAQLSALDRQLDQTFKNIGESPPPALRAAQHSWIRERDRCRTPECVAGLYRSRLAELTQTLPALPPRTVVDANRPEAPRTSPVGSVSPLVPIVPPGPPSGLAPVLGSVTQEQACSAMDSWVKQLLNEFPLNNGNPNRLTLSFTELFQTQLIMVAGLLSDAHFVPFFGRSYDQMTDEDAKGILTAVRRCDRESGNAAQIVFLAEWEPRTPDQRFQRDRRYNLAGQRRTLKSSSDWLARMNGSLPNTPVTTDGLRMLGALEQQAQPQLANVWPSERTAYLNAIESRRTEILSQAVMSRLTNPSVATLSSLENVASGLDEKTATRIRQRINAILEQRLASGSGDAPLSNVELQRFAAYPAVQFARPGIGSDPDASFDRAVWAGSYKCGNFPYRAELMVFGPLKQGGTANLLVDSDPPNREVSLISPVIFEYAFAYDSVLDGLRLTFRKWIMQTTSASPPKQLDLTFENLQTVVRGRTDPSCDVFTLRKKEYPKPLAAALTQMRKDPTWKPPVTLTNASNQDQFCLALAAWGNALRASAPNRDLSRPVGSDEGSRLFKASLFYPPFALPYTGRDLVPAMNYNYDSALATKIRACTVHPLFFEQQSIFTLIYNSLGESDLKTYSQKLRDIEARMARVGQASDRISSDRAGLTQLTDYLTPAEAELAAVVPQVRDAILSAPRRRQIEIAIAILQTESSPGSGARSLQQLVELQDTANLVRAAAGSPIPGRDAILTQVDEVTTNSLQALLATEEQPIATLPPTLESLVRLKSWQSATALRYTKLTAFEIYRTTMREVDGRAAAIQQSVATEMPATIAAAPDSRTIRGIRDSLIAFQKDAKDSAAATALWTSYRSGLDQWFSTAVKKAPAPPAVPGGNAAIARSQDPLGMLSNLPGSTTGTSQLPSGSSAVFSSPQLKEAKLIGAIYRKDFRAVYGSRDQNQEYLFQMMQVIGQSCPGSVSGKFVKGIVEKKLGPGVMTGGPDAMANAGLKILMDQFMELGRAAKNPGQYMNQAIDDGAFAARAQSDAAMIVQSVPCGDPAMTTFTANLEGFFDDPSAGVPESELRMADICQRAMPAAEPSYRKVKYCSCAGPVMERRLTPVQKSYILLDVRQTYWDAVQLIPGLLGELGSCAL